MIIDIRPKLSIAKNCTPHFLCMLHCTRKVMIYHMKVLSIICVHIVDAFGLLITDVINVYEGR